MSTQRSLAAKNYCSDQQYERERTTIFQREWLLIGHQQEIPAIGDQLARMVAGYPILLAHGPDGIRAFYNVCAHRAGPLVWNGTKINSPAIHCRYHGWRYNWEGILTKAPDFGAPCPQAQLKKVHLEVKRGLIFICLSPPQNNLTDSYPALWKAVEPFHLERMPFYKEENHRLRCNWKTYAENYLEGYHVPYLHPSLKREIKMRTYRVSVHTRSISHHVQTKEKAIYDGYWGYVWPNLAINIYGTGFSLERIVPISTGETQIEYLYFFEENLSEMEIQHSLQMSRTVTKEDVEICEAIQHNLRSGAYTAGELSPKHENGVGAFHQWWSQALADLE